MSKEGTSTETVRKRAAVYRNAAKLLEDRAKHSDGQPVDYSCCAIAEAEGIFPMWNNHSKRSSLVDRYQSLILNRELFGPSWQEDERSDRIVALCFMAAMVEAGDA